MTPTGDAEWFGPYFTLSPAETEAAAARIGLRAALRGGLIVSHLVPLAAFILALLFASILALTDFISRRAGEAAVLLAAVAFIMQRLSTHWRIRKAAIWAARRSHASRRAMTASIDERGVTLEGGGRSRRLDYVDCEEAEDAGGLIYPWPRCGAPIVLPTRALGEAARLLVAQINRRANG